MGIAGKILIVDDQPTVRAIAKEAALKGNRFSAYVMGVVNSSAFRQKRAEAAADEQH